MIKYNKNIQNHYTISCVVILYLCWRFYHKEIGYILNKRCDVGGMEMRIDYRKEVAEYLKTQNYNAIVEMGRENNARALRYVQMYIWGDYRNEQRWHAIMALEVLAKNYAADYDETYRNIIRRAVWAMADESGNVPWAAPEMMAAVIKAKPQQYREFITIMITNGLDSPMCHLGVLWSIGHLGADYLQEIAPHMDRIMKFLDQTDGELRGTAVWALKQLQYEPAFDKINSMENDVTKVWIFEEGRLQQKSIGQVICEWRKERLV